MSFKKSRIIPLLTVTAVLALACNPKSENSYTITGTADGTADGDTVYICEIRGNYFDLVPTDTALVTNGQFEFTGECEGASMRWLMPTHGGAPTTITPFILEKGNIKASLILGDGKSEIEGGPNSKLYEEFEKGSSEIGQQMHDPWEVITDSTKTEAEHEAAQSKLDSLNSVMAAYNKKFILDHADTDISKMIYGFCKHFLPDEDKQEIEKALGLDKAEKEPSKK